MIDMHAHILPGVDHGSQSVKMSLELLEKAMEVGIDTVVATPHFYPGPDTLQSFLDKRERGRAKLMQAMQQRSLDCTILMGCEVNLRFGLSELDLRPLCIEGTDILLLEMPWGGDSWQNWAYNEISDIIDKQHLRLLIAHIDRYDTASVMELFQCFPLMGQINARSVVSLLRRNKVRKYLQNGYVWALGSDVHCSVDEYNMFVRSKKYLSEYLDEIEDRSRSLIARKTLSLQPINLT